jgi:hypothetical protein
VTAAANVDFKLEKFRAVDVMQGVGLLWCTLRMTSTMTTRRWHSRWGLLRAAAAAVLLPAAQFSGHISERQVLGTSAVPAPCWLHVQ